ncbi:hypothetical protein BDZ97DRAFT_2082628 [Flammula alnicola]|nr:hypothetical protein BDZ97DRAFT_2082628 [Flammula alnicola]
MEDPEIRTHDIGRSNGDRSYLSCKLSNGRPCPPCMSLLKIDQEIAELITKRRSIMSQVNQNHDPTIHRLPHELASHIFTLSIPMLMSHRKNYKKSLLCAPLILGAVCQKWRQIAWSTPHLWTEISINLLPQKFPQRGQLAQEWLNRSGDLPLSIHLYHSDNSKDLPKKLEPVFYPFIEILNQCSHRWYSLDLDLPSSLISRLGHDSGSIAILHKLRLEFSDSLRLGARRHVDGQFRLDNVLPCPQEVVLKCVPLNCVKIEWNNITHVEARGFRVDECIELLQCAPRMVRCEFREVWKAKERSTASKTIVVHPALQTLLFASRDEIVETIFQHVSCPSLTTLTYYAISRPMPTDAITSFLIRSGCSLHFLHVFGEKEVFAQVLRATPELQHLVLDRPQASVLNFFLQLLASPIPIQTKNPAGEGPLLRNLQFFEYHGLFTFSWEQMLALYGPKYRPASSVEFLSATLPENFCWRHLSSLMVAVDAHTLEEIYIKKDTLLQFMRLRTEGIKLTFVRRQDWGWSDIIEASKTFHGVSEENDGT